LVPILIYGSNVRSCHEKLILFRVSLTRSRDSWFIVVIRVRAERRENWRSITSEEVREDISSPQRPDWLRNHWTSNSVCTEGLYPASKTGHIVKQTDYLNLVPVFRIRGATPPSTKHTLWSVFFKHMGNSILFYFTVITSQSVGWYTGNALDIYFGSFSFWISTEVSVDYLSPGKFQDSTSIGLELLYPNPFQFITRISSKHSALCSLGYCVVRLCRKKMTVRQIVICELLYPIV
jgi:hypothetical protein